MIRIPLIFTLLLYLFPVFAQDETIDEGQYNLHIDLVDQGWLHVTGKNYEVAAQKFDQAIKVYDGNADAFLGRANARMKIDMLDEAKDDVHTALDMTGDQADMFYLAGNIYFKMKEYYLASEFYTKALDFNDQSDVPIDSIHCYYNRGNAHFEAGMYRSAIGDFSKAIEMQEDFTHAYHNRALAYRHRGNMDQACADFSKAKELGDLSSDKYIIKYCDGQ